MGGRPQSGMKKLSAEAQALLHRLLDQGEAPGAIARAIQEQTGERATAAALTRYASAYRRCQAKKQQLRKEVDGLLERAQKEGIRVSDLLRAVLIERLETASEDGTAAELDLLKLEEADRKRGEYELKQRQADSLNRYREWEMGLQERKHSLAEKQFLLQREKVRASVQELERKVQTGESLGAEDLRRIREIFGLGDDPAGHGDTEAQR